MNEKNATGHQARRDKHQGTVAVPPDKDANALVEAIIAEATHKPGAATATRELALARIYDNATRLKVLLAERDAEREGLVAALAEEHQLRALAVVALSPQAEQHQGKVRARDFAFFADSCDTCAALARVKGEA